MSLALAALLAACEPETANRGAAPTAVGTTPDAFFADCDVVPGVPKCSGGPPLVDGWIAFVAQRGPDTGPVVAQVVDLDGADSWSPEGMRLNQPEWAPSGRHIVWSEVVPADQAATTFPIMHLVAYDLSGHRVQSVALTGMERAASTQGSFLPPAVLSLADSDDVVMGRTSAGGTVAVPLPGGRLVQLADVDVRARGQDWLWSDEGLVASLSLNRSTPPGRSDQQVLQIREGLNSSPAVSTTLAGEPDRLLVAWPAPDRLIALRGIHVLANSNWRYPELLMLDVSNGRELPVDVRFPEFGPYILSEWGRHDWIRAHPDVLAVVRADTHQGWRSVESGRVALVDLVVPTRDTVTHRDACCARGPRREVSA